MMESDVNVWSDEVVERSIKTWGTVSTKWTKFAFAEASEGSLIVDLGCGFGRFYKWLTENKKESFSYVGVDKSEWMVRKCRQLYGTSEDHLFFLHDVTEPLSFIEVHYSCTLLCNSVLIHLPLEQQPIVLRNIREARPHKLVLDIESRSDTGDLARVNMEMGKPFYRTRNDPEKFQDVVSALFSDYDMTVRDFPYDEKVSRHVFVFVHKMDKGENE